MTYLLMIWMTISGAQTFATHRFGSELACQSMAHWIIKEQHLQDAHAVCIPNDEGLDI